MKIKGLRPKAPKDGEPLKNFFLNCEGRRKFVQDTKGHHKQHLKKSKHDFYRAEAEFRDMCWDWTIIKAYYSIHHAGNALLSKEKGVFSKDYSCLIVALNYWKLIDESLFEKLVEVYEHFSGILSLDIAFQLRKIGQYSVDEWEELSKEDAELILNLAREFIRFAEGRL